MSIDVEYPLTHTKVDLDVARRSKMKLNLFTGKFINLRKLMIFILIINGYYAMALSNHLDRAHEQKKYTAN